MRNSKFNRHITGNGKRPNKGVQKYGRFTLITDRFFAEMTARVQYERRVKNQKEPNLNNPYN